MSLSLGTREVGYLQKGSWEVSTSYRYLHSEDIYIGTEYRPEFQAASRIRSSGRKHARPAEVTSKGSRAARLVHARGTVRTLPSAVRYQTRSP